MKKSLLLIGGTVFVILILVMFVPKPKGVYINCGLSEISPDFTPDMRRMCREIRGTKL